jgi:hypothetical protein
MNHRKLILAVGIGLGLAVLPSCPAVIPHDGEENAQAGEDPEAAEPRGDAPRISAAQPVFNYGRVSQGDVVEHTFTIVNKGAGDLHIERAKGS